MSVPPRPNSGTIGNRATTNQYFPGVVKIRPMSRPTSACIMTVGIADPERELLSCQLRSHAVRYVASSAATNRRKGTMTEQTLWDYIPPPSPEPVAPEQADRDRARRQTIKKLRSSGHWLTLLRTARTIPQPFTLNDISVAVWRACPEFFGMKGYPYPDNHKVHYILYGDRGLIAKGLIERVSQGLFRVPEGLDVDNLEDAQSE